MKVLYKMAVAFGCSFIALLPALAQTTPPKIGVSVGSLGHPFSTATINGAKAAAEAIDAQAVLTVVSSDWDLAKQDAQIDNFISGGSDLIMLIAADPQAIAPAVARAQAAGIVVSAFDVAAKGADITVMTDNRQAGFMACDELARQIDQKGMIALVGGPSVSSVIDRLSGCEEALKSYPAEVISEGQDPGAGRDGGFAAMQAYLTRFSDIQGVFTINDEQAIGAQLAAKQLGRNEVKITAVDGSPEVVNILRKGDALIVATVAQDPYQMGFEAVRIGWEIVGGNRPKETLILLEPSIITAQNAHDVEGWPQNR